MSSKPPKQDETRLRLGVNIDHVATVRNARGGAYPDPLRAAKLAEDAGADGITAHLRDALMANLTVPLNFEMAATPEMQAIALRHRPHAVCIVPEKREERTTEGGLEVAREENRIAHFIAPLKDAGCRVSIFIAADEAQIRAMPMPRAGSTHAMPNWRGCAIWRRWRMIWGWRCTRATG